MSNVPTPDHDHPIISKAIDALTVGGEVPIDETPTGLWKSKLTSLERQAVISRFPAGDGRITDETVETLWIDHVAKRHPETAAADGQITDETIDALGRINERITNVKQSERRAYAHGYVDALTGRTDGYQRLGGVRHAWTLDRDEPTESFYWTCSCGHVVVQSFGTPAPDELLAHVTEQQG